MGRMMGRKIDSYISLVFSTQYFLEKVLDYAEIFTINRFSDR